MDAIVKKRDKDPSARMGQAVVDTLERMARLAEGERRIALGRFDGKAVSRDQEGTTKTKTS